MVVPAGATVTPEDTQLLGNLATVNRGNSPTNATHYNISPTFNVLLGVQGKDLGSTSTAVQKVVGGPTVGTITNTAITTSAVTRMRCALTGG